MQSSSWVKARKEHWQTPSTYNTISGYGEKQFSAIGPNSNNRTRRRIMKTELKHLLEILMSSQACVSLGRKILVGCILLFRSDYGPFVIGTRWGKERRRVISISNAKICAFQFQRTRSHFFMKTPIFWRWSQNHHYLVFQMSLRSNLWVESSFRDKAYWLHRSRVEFPSCGRVYLLFSFKDLSIPAVLFINVWNGNEIGMT